MLQEKKSFWESTVSYKIRTTSIAIWLTFLHIDNRNSVDTFSRLALWLVSLNVCLGRNKLSQ